MEKYDDKSFFFLFIYGIMVCMQMAFHSEKSQMVAKNVSILVIKGTLAVLILCNFLVWGGPALFGNEKLAAFFQVPYPGDMTYYLRMVGVLTISFGFVYIPAFINPVKYSVLITIAIIDTGLTAIVSIIWLFENNQREVPLFWVTTGLCLLIMISCILFHPCRWDKEQLSA